MAPLLYGHLEDFTLVCLHHCCTQYRPINGSAVLHMMEGDAQCQGSDQTIHHVRQIALLLRGPFLTLQLVKALPCTSCS